jgi:type VI protein secretion system component VasK
MIMQLLLSLLLVSTVMGDEIITAREGNQLSTGTSAGIVIGTLVGLALIYYVVAVRGRKADEKKMTKIEADKKAKEGKEEVAPESAV